MNARHQLLLIQYICMIIIAYISSLSATELMPRLVSTMPAGLPPFVTGAHFSQSNVQIGEILFYSKLLSGKRNLSCSSCHDPIQSFSNNKVPIDLALNRDIPPTINLTYSTSFMWDGAAQQLENQPRLPLESKKEMDINWTKSIKLLKNDGEIGKLLSNNESFLKQQSDIVVAISAYMRTLITSESKFDKFFYQNKSHLLNEEEKLGLKIFQTKGQCMSCHEINGKYALFTDNAYHVLGVGKQGNADLGRFYYTRNKKQKGAFKTPTLRNVTKTAPYMHDGSMQTLREVLEFYNRGGGPNISNKDSKMTPLNLTNQELVALEAFLNTLESEIVSYQPWDRGSIEETDPQE